MRVHLMGGLGNQLFIYAAALAFARRWNAGIAVDAVSGFDHDFVYRREYLLDQFSISAPLVPARERFVGRWGRLRWRLMLKAEELGLACNAWAVIREKTPVARFHARRLHFFDYWQSEDHFAECADLVRREYQLSTALPESSEVERAAVRAQPEAVGLGIRRFMDRPDPGAGYSTPLEFYHMALAEVARRLPRAHVFIVTEDPAWVSQHLKCPLPHTMIAHKESNRRAFENLEVMRACRHFVIGNSTYHWWGAWLGEQPDSRVWVDPQFADANPAFFPKRWRKPD